jgi:transcriptional regulator with XRE-family HTH domain
MTTGGYKMDLGFKIKTLRKQLKLTQEDLAKKASISRSYLADIERNRYNPSVDTLINISKSLGISLSELVSEHESVMEKNDKEIVENNFPMIPDKFIKADEARDYVMKHQILAYGGLNPAKMSDEEILDFANEMLNQAELLGLKYSMKKKR